LEETLNVDLTVFKSFSRDGNKHKYVQHAMKENEKLILDLLLNHHASIYVAGNSKNMPNGFSLVLTLSSDVLETFESMLVDKLNFSKEDSKNYFRKLQSLKRYQTGKKCFQC
jgi:sulfite reductase alpha subunit-like flavoprotein